MKTKRFLQLTHAMCEQAVLEAFDKNGSAGITSPRWRNMEV